MKPTGHALSGYGKVMFDQPNTCTFLLQPDATEGHIYAVSMHLGVFKQMLVERGHRLFAGSASPIPTVVVL